ncbi:Hsp70 nucleotide exchange factor FES1 [Nakaseomyces bracarensis]|uniref:Hsp70 nucleotide exchange factor FES1 n=1 Tax=Nakaseomyces bracarensis TaxID=273131 RepID=A0ABR4NY10_9SACH
MEKLLHWSIANAQGDKEAIDKAGAPDPKLLEQLFGGGGPDDPTLMKEAMAVITNPEADLENKLIAYENFEMLIENLDNANNIENMKLWEPILSTLDYDEADLRATGLSVIGTAVQNNTPSQDNFIKYEGSVEKLIDIAKNKNEKNEVRIKALYALSNLIRNHEKAAQVFSSCNGLDALPVVLNDTNATPKLKLRAISVFSAFLSAVTIDEKLLDTLRKDNVLVSTIENLGSTDNVNLIDRVLAVLAHLISSGIQLNSDEIEKLKQEFDRIEPVKERLNEDDYLIVKYVLSKK